MDMGVGVVVPVRMPVVMGMAMRLDTGLARRMTRGMVVMVRVGRGGNHAQDVIL